MSIFGVIPTCRADDVGSKLGRAIVEDYYKIRCFKEVADNLVLFSPPDISNLVGWYDARIDANIGAAPTRDWTNEHAAEVATGNGTIDYIDLRDSLLFEGNFADFYSMPSPVLAPPFTVIAGVTPQPGQTENGTVWSASDSALANRYSQLAVDASGNWEARSRITGTTGIAGGTTAASQGVFQVVAAEWAAVDSRRISIDNGAFQTNATSVAHPISRNDVGKTRERTNNIAGTAFLGEVHWILIYSRALTGPEHTSIYNWGNTPPTPQLRRDSNGFAVRDSNGNPLIYYP